MYEPNKTVEDAERTAFRRAEKTYKLYYDPRCKRNKKQPKHVDLSHVLDFKPILSSYNQRGQLPQGTYSLQCDLHVPVFCFNDRPGFYFIPGALSVEEQTKWIRESLLSFPQPPNRTNHNAIYGPVHDLFAAAKENKKLIEEPLDSRADGDASTWKLYEENNLRSKGQTCKAVSTSVLLRKLRWSTLGLQFDWSKRNYNVSLPHNKIPDALCDLAKRMASPAMPLGEDFRPEAAIVNYFGSGDALGGHVDDMELDWNKPIVSMSLGCKCIFLIGGKSRDDPPLAIFLRSGDVLLMAGEARECFHGVPRIFTDKENAEIAPLELEFTSEDDFCFLEYIRSSRININIRQVF